MLVCCVWPAQQVQHRWVPALGTWHALHGTGVIVCVMSIWSAALPFMLTVAGTQGIHGAVAGGGNVNMLQQQLPHFFMLCGAAIERKTGIATLLAGEDVMWLDMANAHSLSGTVFAKLCSAG